MDEKLSFYETDRKYYYGGELGAVYSKEKTEFAVWSPYAKSIELRLFKNGAIGVIVKGELQKARAVAQVDEAKRTKVAATLYPTHHANALANIFLIQRTAIVGALVLFGQKFSHVQNSFIRSLRRHC